MMEDDEQEQDYDDTVEENEFFASTYRRYAGPESFLGRSEKIFARGIQLTPEACSIWLDFKTDVDGCVVELKHVSGFLKPVGHLNICPLGRASLKGCKGELRKHVDLRLYKRAEIENFQKCFSTQLFYERGWDCRFALIPVPARGSVSLSQEIITEITFKACMQLKAKFERALRDFAQRGIATRTLAKNDLNNAGRVRVLPDDCASILSALDGAIGELELDTRFFRPIVYCFRFGEKMKSGIKMNAFDRKEIERVTVHAAVDIESFVDGIDLMWSMSGLQEVVGERGTLSTCLSLNDCGNYQSNLDGRALSIQPELKSICRDSSRVTFVQLYADIPHRMPKSRFHPVSGLIAGGLCFPTATVDAFCRDSNTYLSALDSNWTLLHGSTCRLEVVSTVNVQSDIIDATDVIDMAQVRSLLQTKPMLVPLPESTIVCIRDVGLWITGELQRLMRNFKRTGNVQATWTALQLELASEKMLWGRPLCHMSDRYSVNLGPGLLRPTRSLTDDLGFLALDTWSACVADEDCIPLYTIWTRSEAIGKGMIRAAGFHDYIESSYPVIGRRLLLALLNDFFELGKAVSYVPFFGKFLTEMQAKETTYQTVGSMTTQKLCRMLSDKRRMPVHMVFGCLRQLLEKAQLPVKEVLDAGLKELKLTHFPAVQIYDGHYNATLSWSFRNGFWMLVSAESSGEGSQISPDTYFSLVKGELERRQLVYPSKLKRIAVRFPWMIGCLQKLKCENLDTDGTVTMLAFISCIALIMDGWYVDFQHLSLLESEMPVSQNKLKILEIQSKLLLPSFTSKTLMLFRLHQSIPHRLQEVAAQPSGSRRQEPENPESVHENVDEDVVKVAAPRIGDDNDSVSVSEQVLTADRRTVCKPVGLKRTLWSSDELEILNNVAELRSDKSVSELYKKFCEECGERGIAFRTLHAFRMKLKNV